MIDNKYFSNLKKRYLTTGQGRRKLSELSNQAQYLSKQAIFALQRGEINQGQKMIEEALVWLKKGQAMYQQVDDLEHQGSFRAALEEYAEAVLLIDFLNNKKIGKINNIEVPLEVYLGALSDMVGELVRYAVKMATAGQIKKIPPLVDEATIIVSQMAAMNMTGSLRSKFDQAKNHLRKLEDIQYDLSVKRHVD